MKAKIRPLPSNRSDRRLWIAIGASLAFHGLLLSLHFAFPEASRVAREKALDIILVNARSQRSPADAQARITSYNVCYTKLLRASSDPWQIPVGARIDVLADGESRIARFAGREYLACGRAAQGYQGYAGPGWYGLALAPLEHAFALSA